MVKKESLHKMEALTIKTFETNKISAAKVSENRSKDFKYKSVTFAFKFENKNAQNAGGADGPVYFLAINCTGDNESFFRKLNSVLANQSCKILKDHTVTPENFELVKENKYGCSVFAKIYLRKSGKARGSHKNLIEIDELVDENFRGSCILKIYQAYIGSSKSISLSVEEILVRNMEKTSYFADEDEDEDSDSESENEE